jgi:NAD(P)-dependent dehydrogenase (short-subunit alcohol dehydrogenase family)
MNEQKVWFITGASRGMGLEVARAVLAKGGKVAGTSRHIEELKKNISAAADCFLPLQLDITSDEAVKAGIARCVETFGRIDVVLNNAGYYLAGSIEAISDEEFRKTIEVNLFGTVNVTRHALPHLRAQQSGHIINISSNMGYIGYANTGSYNAAKFAVIGLSEALAQEVQPFGIKVTVVAPGMFRTGFMTSDTLAVAQNDIKPYGLQQHVAMLQSFSGHQPGDPRKLAEVLYHISQMEQPPLHLPLGTDSYASILAHRQAEAAELAQWENLSRSTDFA